MNQHDIDQAREGLRALQPKRMDPNEYTVGEMSRPELSAFLGVDLENWQWLVLVQLVGTRRVREAAPEEPF